MLSTFASIGLSALVPALGLRKNVKEYVLSEESDASAPDRLARVLPADEVSWPLPSGTTAEARYVNERSRFGWRRPLRRNALLLYVYLHFLSPDGAGYVAKIDAEDVAEALGCSPRTVSNNLRLLHEAGYVSVARSSVPCRYQAFIAGYAGMFRRAAEGGRGFVRLGRDFMDGLVRMPDVNSVRLAIRSYLRGVEATLRRRVDRERSFRDVKSELPEYVTKKTLLSVLGGEAFRSMFSVSVGKRTATIVVLPEHDQAKAAEAARADCERRVSALAAEIGKKSKGGRRAQASPPLRFTAKELSDVAAIALRLPVESVLAGVSHFYETYVKRGLRYDNAGALVRAFASDHALYGFVAG